MKKFAFLTCLVLGCLAMFAAEASAFHPGLAARAGYGFGRVGFGRVGFGRAGFYGAPLGVNAFGVNPFGVNPYGAGLGACPAGLNAAALRLQFQQQNGYGGGTSLQLQAGGY